MRPDLLESLLAATAARRPAVLLTRLDSGAQELVLDRPDGRGGALGEAIAEAFATGLSRTVEADAGEVFLQACVPAPRLVIVGATQTAQFLAPMGRMAGFDVTLVDPRETFASALRFPDVRTITDWPEEAFRQIGLDRHTAVVTLAHQNNIDEEALILALDAGCFYVGALGSRRTHAKRVESMRKRGVGEAAIARIRAPIGLNIGALAPGEIAVSVIAEVVSLRRAHAAKDKAR